VLTIDMSAPITERSSEEGNFSLNGFDSNSSIGLRDFVQTLEKAAADENVEGIYLNFESVPVAPSTLTDVRAALEAFKSSGKWIVSWSEGMTLGGLYVASVADELFMHPNGYADISGMRLQTTYYTGMLEKMGVGMTVLRGPDNEYKSAVEPFTRKSMSESNREQLNALLDDIWSEVRSGIASGRRIDAQQLDEIAENLLLRTAEDGMNLEIFDGLLYQDELKDRLKEKIGGENPVYVSLSEYMDGGDSDGFEASFDFDFLEALNDESYGETEEAEPLGGELAVIYATGGIEMGSGDAETIGSETLSKAIRSARLAPDVKGVVLRVSSPGGSALASDIIWREAELLKESGKTFVVSMGDYAASGGYYISAGAEKIFASPNTITGSIGVFGMLPYATELLEDKMGLAYDDVRTHSHAGIGLEAQLDPLQLEALNESITDIYEDFIGIVAEGRGMTTEEVDAIARGRVWTGQDAMEIGLVDELGNLQDAIDAAALMAGLDSLTEDDLVYLPKQLDPFEQFLEDLASADVLTETLLESGVSHAQLKQWLTVQKMLTSGDRFQARLPFFIEIQ
ncbi:MAG: signal peptide peptidase SppA, partial [Flavobacteriales bacterium]